MSHLEPLGQEAQETLNRGYQLELAGPQDFNRHALAKIRSDVRKIEATWMAHELQSMRFRDLPSKVEDFESWYRSCFHEQLLAAENYFDHLANFSCFEELAIYVLYEELVDGRFDDVIALAQLGLKGRAKLALASNFWDEMGEGDEKQMHTFLFQNSAEFFRIELSQTSLMSLVKPNAEALANGNLLLMLAIRRENSARLLGALTLLEHTAPKRFARVAAAMRRLKLPEEIIYYHELHVRVDAKHGDDLLHIVLLPMLREHPRLLHEVATGVLLRLQVANRYYEMLASVRESLLGLLNERQVLP